MKAYAALVRRAAAVCNAPMAGLAILKGGVAHVEAQIGLEALGSEIPLACCPFLPDTLYAQQAHVVSDSLVHPRYAQSAAVAQPPHIRFFAGVPLRAGDGAILGTLAVMDTVPRTIQPAHIAALRDLGEAVQELLETSRRSALLEGTIDHAGDCISIHELAPNTPWPGQFVYINDHALARTGFSREEIAETGAPFAAVSGEERAELTRALLDVRGGRERQFELPIVCSDGSRFWGDVQLRPLPDDDGVIRRYVMICRDISGRRDAERTMRLLSRAIDEALDFVVVTDFTPPSAGGPFIEYANAPFLQATGYAAGDLVGRSATTLFAQENDPAALETIVKNIESGNDTEKELLIRRADGTTFWVEYTGRPLRQPDGQFSHWVWVGRDISMRRRTHEQMAALLAAIDAVDRHVEIYAMENGKYTLAFQNAAVNDDTSELVGTLLNELDIPGDTPLREELRAGKNVIVTPDGLEIRPLDSDARTVVCIRQKD